MKDLMDLKVTKITELTLAFLEVTYNSFISSFWITILSYLIVNLLIF